MNHLDQRAARMAGGRVDGQMMERRRLVVCLRGGITVDCGDGDEFLQCVTDAIPDFRERNFRVFGLRQMRDQPLTVAFGAAMFGCCDYHS